MFNHDGIPKKLVVTSPGMREGKTTFAINFATSIAKSGKKVLLIDGDLRKPDIAYLLNLPKGTQGLQNISVYSIHSTGLNVLASHSCNGIDVYELISSPLTIEQINKISQSYDNVIIDTPPMLAFPETLVWAKIADAVILTSFTGQTTATDLKEAKQRLTEINVRVLGTVLSNVPAGRGYYRYDYNYYAQNTQSRKKSKRRSKQLLLTPQANRTIEEIPAPKQTIWHKAKNIKF